MFMIIGWVVGVVLVGYGLLGLAFTAWFVKANEELTRNEIEMMKKGGLLEGEPEYMRDFRVVRSEWDLETDKPIIWIPSLFRYGIPFLAGLVIIGFLFLKAWR